MRPQRAVGEYALPSSLAGWFTVTEVDDVEAHAGDLFRRAFRAPPPPTPHHYVARVEMNGKPRTIGYVHYERVPVRRNVHGRAHVSPSRRRAPQRAEAAGGVAEQMLRHTFADLAHAKAIFGYVG